MKFETIFPLVADEDILQTLDIKFDRRQAVSKIRKQ